MLKSSSRQMFNIFKEKKKTKKKLSIKNRVGTFFSVNELKVLSQKLMRLILTFFFDGPCKINSDRGNQTPNFYPICYQSAS